MSKKIKIKIDDLFDRLSLQNEHNIPEISFKNQLDIKIKNDKNEYVPIYEFVIKNTDSYEIQLSNGDILICSDKHIMKTTDGDKTVREIYDNNLNIVNLKKENCKIKSLKIKKIKDNLFDFCLDEPHLWQDSMGYVHHNSFAIYFLLNFMLKTNKTSLLLVSKLGLIAQMKKDLVSYGMDESLIKCIHGQTDKIFSGQVNISTWQSIYKMTAGEIDVFDCVICDEVHEAKATSISSILSKLKRAEYRIGTTGTLPKGNTADYYTIIANLGEPKLYRSYEELKTDGILSPIMIHRHILLYPEYEQEHCYNELRKDYHAEIEYLMNHDNRNNYIIDLLKNECKTGNTLVLFQYIEKHGKILLDMFKQRIHDKKIIYIDGSVKIDDRELAREIAEANSDVIILASYGVFAVGVNIKNLHNIIFASSTKSFTRVCQSIGRGLRTHQSKEVLNVYDLIDDLSYREGNKHYDNYLLGHGKDRLKIYNAEGFPSENKQISIF